MALDFINKGLSNAWKFWIYHHRRLQHIYQKHYRITAASDQRITAAGDKRITADSDY